MRLSSRGVVPALISLCAVACGDGSSTAPDAGAGLAHALFVAREGSLVSFDLATGAERPGTVTGVTGPVDLQVLDDGHLIVNLTGAGEVLVVDPLTMLEAARLRSSATTGTRPVHGYLTPVLGGRQYWMALHDGDGTAPTNTARFIDVTAGSATRFQAVGETRLGIGHHKAAFSRTRPRVVISNIADCGDLLSVYDFGDPAQIQRVATLTAEAAGWDGVARTCEAPTLPAPHGCATAPSTGKAYCSLTGTGDLVVVDLDAEQPTFTVKATGGSGGGYTQAHPGGRYLYTMQAAPRQGRGGPDCQIGQIVVTDAMTEAVAAEVPLTYTGPGCTAAVAGDEAKVAPDHTYFARGGDALFIALNAGFGDAAARSRQAVALDTSDPARPVQLPSIAVGASTGHGAGAVDGPGARVYIVNAVDGTVSEIDAATRAVTRTLAVGDAPRNVATYGAAEGPSHQTGPVE